MRKLATEWAEAGQKKSFQELLQILYKRGDYQSQSAALPVNDHWDQLDPTAFFDLLWELPVVNPFSDWRPPGDVVAAEDLILTRQTVFGLVYIPGVVRRLHIHDFFEIDIVLRGNGRLSFKQQTRVCQAGDICILFPGAHHDLKLDRKILPFHWWSGRVPLPHHFLIIFYRRQRGCFWPAQKAGRDVWYFQPAGRKMGQYLRIRSFFPSV